MVLPVVVDDDQLPETVWLPLGGMQLAAEELRRAHLGVLSTAQTLLLVKEGGDKAETYSAAALGELMAISPATQIIAPRARQTGDTWHFVVDVFDGKRVASFEGDAGHSLDALRLAMNAYLGSQGLSPLEHSSVLPSTELALRLDTARSPDEVAAAERLLAAASDELRNLPEISVRAGSLALKSGDMPRARALFEALASRSGLAPEVNARVQAGLGSVAIAASAYAEAETHFSSALALLAEPGDAADPALVARTYLARGGARSALGRFDEGLDDLGRARVAMERIGDEIGIAEVDWNLGLTQADLGRYNEATKTLDRAIDIFSRFGISDNLAVVLVAKAEAQLALLQYEDALASSSRASELVPKLTYELLVEHVQTVHIKALLLTGRLAKAEAELDRMATRLPEDARFVADLLQGALLEQRGSLPDAATRVRGALTATGQLPASREQRPAEMGLLLLDASRNTPAMKAFDQGWPALASAEAANDGDWPWVAALAEAEIRAARGDGYAPAQFAAAMEAAERRGSPWAIARTGTAFLLYLQRTNNLDKVPALLGRLAPYARQDFRTAIAAAAAYRRIGADRLADEMFAQAAQVAGERSAQMPPW
ncbi:MAG: tetratricopeptide repeat protein [Dokdonella sp.]